MGRHVRGQAKHIRRREGRRLWQQMTAGVLTSAVLLGLSSGLSSAVGKPAEQVEPSLVVARYVFSGENPVSEEELQQLLQRHRRQLATLKQLEELGFGNLPVVAIDLTARVRLS